MILYVIIRHQIALLAILIAYPRSEFRASSEMACHIFVIDNRENGQRNNHIQLSIAINIVIIKQQSPQ